MRHRWILCHQGKFLVLLIAACNEFHTLFGIQLVDLFSYKPKHSCRITLRFLLLEFLFSSSRCVNIEFIAFIFKCISLFVKEKWMDFSFFMNTSTTEDFIDRIKPASTNVKGKYLLFLKCMLISIQTIESHSTLFT